MRMLMALIGYVATATVLAAGLGLAYLWQTQRLDDEKVFRIVALLHDVDVDGLNAEAEDQNEEIPDEEPSLEDIESYRAVFARNYEVKQDALKRGRQEFDHMYKKVQVETERFEDLAQKIGQEFERQKELSTKENVAKVVKQYQDLRPDVAKELLIRTLDEPDGMNDVILLMNAMSPSKLKKVLLSFQTQQELDALHSIHRLMLDSGPHQQLDQEALDQFEALGTAR